VAGRKGFGSNVAVSGLNLAVGTTYGRAYVYVSDEGAWRRTADLKSSSGNSEYFGNGVALSGATLMAASISDDSNAGRVFVFTNRVTGWKQTAELAGRGVGAGSLFGTQVVSSGTDLVGTTAQGRVFVFTDGPKGWGKPTELGGPGTDQGAGGGAVAISGNTIVIGDPGYDKGKGVAYVYTNTGSRWRESAQLANLHSKTGDGFGYSVGISGNNVVVGADYAEGYRGAAYVFTGSAGKWKQVAELDPSGTIPNSNFGTAVAISGTTIVVGTNGDTGCDELSINGGPSQAVDCAPPASWGAYVYSETAAGWHEVTDLHPPST
jgi:FG-GAP repeat